MKMGKSKDNGKKLKFFRLDNMQIIKGQDFGDIRIKLKYIQVLIILIRIKVTYLGEQNKDKKSRRYEKIYYQLSRGDQYDRMGLKMIDNWVDLFENFQKESQITFSGCMQMVNNREDGVFILEIRVTFNLNQFNVFYINYFKWMWNI
ncbi:unnamed protein product [Paramecium pentaurelia]|uniref:Uncharacterized protein n=1 Tax=Paramecium pentaurelia TaxID=43138 RepID=A0A8S1UMA7_9CILI|nr:unnamed protein product [Paramecium pentaurelia]